VAISALTIRKPFIFLEGCSVENVACLLRRKKACPELAVALSEVEGEAEGPKNLIT